MFSSTSRLPAARRQGFTLIELLLVVAIIGILATLALPQFGSVKKSTYQSSAQSDLHNLITAQEMYAARNGGSYASDTTALLPYFTPSAGIKIQIDSGTQTGWGAVDSTLKVPGSRCSVAVSQSAAAGTNGVIQCTGW